MCSRQSSGAGAVIPRLPCSRPRNAAQKARIEWALEERLHDVGLWSLGDKPSLPLDDLHLIGGQSVQPVNGSVDFVLKPLDLSQPN